jgi:hypothetical protein
MTLGTDFVAYEVTYRQSKIADDFAAANGRGRHSWRRLRRQHGRVLQARPSARPAHARARPVRPCPSSSRHRLAAFSGR